jgi:uncharacterized RmlC-like cupin family protein
LENTIYHEFRAVARTSVWGLFFSDSDLLFYGLCGAKEAVSEGTARVFSPVDGFYGPNKTSGSRPGLERRKVHFVDSTIRGFDDLEWVPLPGNPNVNVKELLSREESGALNLNLWRILFEKIEPGAAVLPHYHDTAEVIHFIRGEVHVLVGEERSVCRPGDSLIVKSGTIHGVANKGTEPTTQISYFVPAADQGDFGLTEQVPGVEI